jgi:predicted GIY-YIG superfamily endonuclease
MPSNAERTALYRLYDADDRLLYIGVSKRPKLRFEEHRMNGSRWISQVTRRDITWHPSRPEALAAEKAAIQTEHPRHNGTYNYDDAPMPIHWRPVSGSNKTGQVADLMRAEMDADRWRMEQRIPSAEAIAAAAGVSTRTVGNAMSLLKAEGLLDFRSGHGLFVDWNPPIPASMVAPDGRLYHNWAYDRLG